FHTPLGTRTVLHKVVDPIWAKPVWAFVENREEPPILLWEARRLDLTTLGAYALKLGDGYEIHGTLYPSLLGRHITHGCIRLNDDDLAFAYRTLHVGDRVYIY
ncbi:MAG: L,D-transpeptidase, partial [Candidatus Latescibacteria bacterium]|nr:L,D-transpeptidase [Candidatus Latescibacterota bacterium]